MSHLTSALEKLYQSITRLEQAIDERNATMDTQQRDLFSQLEDERDRNKSVTKELDDIIAQMEKTLKSNVA